jgi:hypothetical protein
VPGPEFRAGFFIFMAVDRKAAETSWLKCALYPLRLLHGSGALPGAGRPVSSLFFQASSALELCVFVWLSALDEGPVGRRQ